jgi:hypothetical protein
MLGLVKQPTTDRSHARLGALLLLFLGFGCGPTHGEDPSDPDAEGGGSGSAGGSGGVLPDASAASGGQQEAGGAAGSADAASRDTAVDAGFDRAGGGDLGGGEVSHTDAPGGSPGSAALDACFAGLRPLASRAQIATKQNATGAYAVRLALEAPPGAPATTGSVAWRVVRVGIVIPIRTVCFDDEAALANVYKSSPHNCADTMTVSMSGLNYTIRLPDTDPRRADTTLNITGSAGVPPVKLTTVSCSNGKGAACESGGPCQ